MNLEDFKDLEIGDRIEFRSVTRHNTRKAVRIITDFPTDYDWDHLVDGKFARSSDHVMVRFEGTANFYVRRGEVIRKVAE